MTICEVTIEDLKHILREGAGTDKNVDLDGEILDTGFDALGYRFFGVPGDRGSDHSGVRRHT